jgi:hypothetical protein
MPRASGWPALDAAGRPPARTAAHGAPLPHRALPGQHQARQGGAARVAPKGYLFSLSTLCAPSTVRGMRPARGGRRLRPPSQRGSHERDGYPPSLVAVCDALAPRAGPAARARAWLPARRGVLWLLHTQGQPLPRAAITDNAAWPPWLKQTQAYPVPEPKPTPVAVQTPAVDQTAGELAKLHVEGSELPGVYCRLRRTLSRGRAQELIRRVGPRYHLP